MNTPHHRHPVTTDKTDYGAAEQTKSEASPLASWQDHGNHGHLSMMEEGESEPSQWFCNNSKGRHKHKGLWVLLVLVSLGLVVFSVRKNNNPHLFQEGVVVPVQDAQEYWLELPPDDSSTNDDVPLQIWYRVWGRMDGTGIPLLFVHGGPGNAIADYFGNSNQRFFGSNENDNDSYPFLVVEVDQRGTGHSQPSVRDGWQNMKYYKDISITKMVADFEVVRRHLKIDQWLVWGGSFGSTLAIHYGQEYPDSTLALILRGLYLDTAEEVYTVYSRSTYLDHPKRLNEYDILYDYAAKYVQEHHKGTDEPSLDPNDAERLLRIYAEMISNGDEHAIWHWFVFENNLMELDPKRILDPDHINKEFYRESLSVAFFETHLWLHGSFDSPTSDLLDRSKIQQLTMPLWVCQGQHDEVCPKQYAQRFVDSVVKEDRSPWVVSRFVNGTHEDTDPAIETCLKRSLQEFVQIHNSQ